MNTMIHMTLKAAPKEVGRKGTAGTDGQQV